jgi:hypothetical protein
MVPRLSTIHTNQSNVVALRSESWLPVSQFVDVLVVVSLSSMGPMSWSHGLQMASLTQQRAGQLSNLLVVGVAYIDLAKSHLGMLCCLVVPGLSRSKSSRSA